VVAHDDFTGAVAVGAFVIVVVADDLVDVVLDFAVARRTGFLRKANWLSFSLSSVEFGAFLAAMARVATMTVARMWS
jgi:hypothetical protein